MLKRAGKRVKDDDAQTACSSACPTSAIVLEMSMMNTESTSS